MINQGWWRLDKLTGLEKRLSIMLDGIDWLKSAVVSLAKIFPVKKKEEEIPRMNCQYYIQLPFQIFV